MHEKADAKASCCNLTIYIKAKETLRQELSLQPKIALIYERINKKRRGCSRWSVGQHVCKEKPRGMLVLLEGFSSLQTHQYI